MDVVDKGLTFNEKMLATANYDGRFTRLYEVQGEKLRAIADFFNEPDAYSVIRMAHRLTMANREVDALREELNSYRKELALITSQRNELLITLKCIIDDCSVEVAEKNGFGPARMKASEVYDRIMWGKPNEGGAK